jgi:hypothetical protein
VIAPNDQAELVQDRELQPDGPDSALTRQTNSAFSALFLFAGRETRLPSCGLLAWRRSDCLDFLFFGFLGLPIAFLLAFGHVDLPGFDDVFI